MRHATVTSFQIYADWSAAIQPMNGGKKNHPKRCPHPEDPHLCHFRPPMGSSWAFGNQCEKPFEATEDISHLQSARNCDGKKHGTQNDQLNTICLSMCACVRVSVQRCICVPTCQCVIMSRYACMQNMQAFMQVPVHMHLHACMHPCVCVRMLQIFMYSAFAYMQRTKRLHDSAPIHPVPYIPANVCMLCGHFSGGKHMPA